MTRIIPLIIASFLAVSAIHAQPVDRPADSQPVANQIRPDAVAPVTILISIDGFRPDYLGQGNTPNMDALKANGASAILQPSFPTKTFPNHYTLVTGLRPDRHGIVDNNMVDPRRPGEKFSLGDSRQSLDPFWWNEAEPIWVTAEKSGLRTATMFWPGSEVAIQNVRPQDWLRFDEQIGDVQRVNTVLDWMRRPAVIRPKFVTLYFETVDTSGHRFGPRSPETRAAIAEVDARIGDLISGLQALNMAVDIVIVSDHGMAQIDPSRVIQLNDLIDAASMLVVTAGAFVGIESVTGTDNRVADALLKPHDHMDCMRKADLPERLHYGSHQRVAEIICIPQSGWSVISGEPRYPVTGGNHGYDNIDPDMQALFIASGPSIRQGLALDMVDNVHVYPLIAQLIGVTPLPSDGRAAALADKIMIMAQ